MKYLLGLALLAATFSHAAEPVNVVFLYGNRSHGPGAHEFKAGSILLAKCLEEQKAVPVKCQVFSNWPADHLDALEKADAIVFYNDATRIVNGHWDEVDALAKKGKGLMFMHYAVHPSQDKGEQYFLPWMGGYFKNGQSVNPMWNANIRPLKGHPTSNGVGEIECIDEFYHTLEFCKDCDLSRIGVAKATKDNLLTINNLWTPAGFDSVGKDVTLLWALDRPDGSRGAGFTGGHFHHNWAWDELRQLVLNTVVWVAGREVPKDGIPVRPLTEDELNANLDDYGAKNVRLALPTRDTLPKFEANDFLTPEQHKHVRKENPDWMKKKGQLINAQITPAK